jgi:polar amino acid transport system substrate-binding protein
MHRRLRLALFVLVITSGLLAACSGGAAATPLAPADMLGEIRARGRLVVATETAYPPQSELIPDAVRVAGSRCAPTEYTANQLRGFDVEVAVEIARRLGVEACFVAPTWTQVVSGGWGGRWDISIGSMVITPERMQALYFTQPYAAGSAVFFVHQDNRSYTRPDDLSGKRIGVCAGCAYESYLKGSLVIPGQTIHFVVKDATIVGYDTDTSALEDLAAGDGARLDAVLTDPDTGQTAKQSGLPLKQLGDPVYYDYVAAAIDRQTSKESTSFIEKITETIQAMHRDGTLVRLSQQYYGQDTTTAAGRFDVRALEQMP